MLYESGQGPEVFLRNAGSMSRKRWGANLSLGTWHHIVGTHVASATTLTLYVDGVAGGAMLETAGSNPANANNVMIGQDGTSTTPFRFLGLLDDIRIYNRVLSPAEVQALYNAER